MGKGEFPEANRDASEKRISGLGLGLVPRRGRRAGKALPLQIASIKHPGWKNPSSPGTNLSVPVQ
jgi:hypothetical protein